MFVNIFAFDIGAITPEILPGLLQAISVYVLLVIGAIVILILGWFIAAAIGKFVSQILKKAKFNQLFERKGWKEALERAEWKVDPAGFIGEIVKWILMVVTLLVAVDILGFTQFASFLEKVVLWLPNVVVSIAIFVVAAIIADYLAKLMRIWVEGMQVGYGRMVETIVRWSVWGFAIFAILIQLQIAEGLVTTLFTGIVALIVIAGGIAFGLGGKDMAADILSDVQRRIKG